eukprot:8301233-Alexandrium_andersonii.AAC.1
MGEDAFTQQLGAPHPVRALSPIVPRPSGGGPERALKGLRGGGLASLWGLSAIGRRPAHRLKP